MSGTSGEDDNKETEVTRKRGSTLSCQRMSEHWQKASALKPVYNNTMATETVTLEGHIIDSLILAKVLDAILQRSGVFTINEMQVGATREDASSATIAVHADSPQRLAAILHAIQPHGAVVEHAADCTLEPARKRRVAGCVLCDLAPPDAIRLNHHWLDVEAIEMDVAIRVTPDPPDRSHRTHGRSESR